MMEVETTVMSISRSMLRPEDATRLARPFHHDDHDRPRAASENNRLVGDRADLFSPVDDSSPKDEGKEITQLTKIESPLLSLEDTTELFERKIADARKDTEHALAGNEEINDAVKPTLTLDLGHSSIARLPETVVDLIKAEVERLSLSHNQIWFIPLRFCECSTLRYLNIRSNAFRDIPRPVYKLPLLEILDISRNKVRKISKEIRNLTSLRVFSLVHNRVDDLPTELCEMTKLQILKVAENPLRFKLRKAVEAKEAEVAYSEMTDNEREIAVTLEIKRFLRDLHPMPTPIDAEAASELIESPLETPKPFKRVVSSRFPVIPSINSIDMGTDKSPPNQFNAPPIPTRSHYRMTSGQGAVMRRPGIAPLISNNERNRSNSESVLQASAAARSKRMGMMRKERTDLDSIKETKMNRNSHLRGFSHASVLKRTGDMSSPGGGSSSSPNSPKDSKRHRLGFVKRLSSLPEHKSESRWHNPIIEGAKGVLYGLYQIHPQISGLIAAISREETKRSSLEITFYNASMHVDGLNKALEQADLVDVEDEESVEKVEETVQRDCATCIMAYTHVTAQLRDNVRKVVAGTDARYVRTLMLLLFGSMMEMRNAINSFGADFRIKSQGHRRHMSSGNTKKIQTIPEEYSTPLKPVHAPTPTQDRFPPVRQGTRLRSDTTIQHPILENLPPQQPSVSSLTSPPSSYHYIGTTMNGGVSHSANSSFTTASTLNSNGSYGIRSRSNSRNTSVVSITNSSLSSVASTPRSGEAFNIPTTFPNNLRINPATGLTDAQEEATFEQIFLALTRAYDAALQAIPLVEKQFTRCLEASEISRQSKDVHDLWSTLIYRCKSSQDVTEGLQIRLLNLRMKSPITGSSSGVGERNDPSFWLLCKTFLQSFVELVTDMKEAKRLRLLPPEIIMILRPVQKASREAARLIETSPWRYLSDGASSMPVPPSFSPGSSHSVLIPGPINDMGNNFSTYSSAMSQHHVHQSQTPFPPSLVTIPLAPAMSSGSGMLPNGFDDKINGASPVSVPLPATPMSAALGPAAQATLQTVPSTPASTYGDSFFKGDVFQRADSLLSMPQVGTVNFLNRR